MVIWRPVSGVQEAGTALMRLLAEPAHAQDVLVAMENEAARASLTAMMHEPWGVELREIAIRL